LHHCELEDQKMNDEKNNKEREQDETNGPKRDAEIEENIFVEITDEEHTEDQIDLQEPGYLDQNEDNTTERTNEDMELQEEEPRVNEIQAILDQLIQGNVGMILQDDSVFDNLEEVAGVVFQNVEDEQLFIVREQMLELFPGEEEMDDADNDAVVDDPANYVVGDRNMERVLARLFDEEYEDHGQPPMDAEQIKNIDTTMVDQAMFDKISMCPICCNLFKVNEEVNILECNHIFHGSCIKPWLLMHATCPVCRMVLGES